MRRLPALLLLLTAAACGGEEPATPAGTGPTSPGDPAPAKTGPFRLLVDPRGKPGRPPPLRVAGRAEGVELTVYRFPDPIARRISGEPGGEELVFTVTFGAGRTVLPPLPGGEYRAVARRDGREETSDFVVTDLVVVVRLAGDDLLLYVADAESGAPARGAAVEAGGPEGRVTGRTDSSGVFRTRARLGDRVYAVASTGDRLGSAEFVRSAPVRNGPVFWLVTDRPAYAPGETVRFLGLVRIASRGRLLCPDRIEGRFDAFDAAGRRVGEGVPVPAPAACFSGTFVLDPGAEEGEGRLRVRIAGGMGEALFMVLPPADPGLAVSITALESTPVAGGELSFRIEVSHEHPDWLAGGRLRWEARREDPRRPEGSAPAGSGERLLTGPDVLVATVVAEAPGRYALRAEAADAGGNVVRAGIAVEVDPAALTLALHTGREFYARGEMVEVSAWEWSPTDRSEPWILRIGADTHDLSGVRTGRFELPREAGPCRIVVEARDAAGRLARAEKTVWVLDGGEAGVAGDAIRIVPEKRGFAAGEEARVLLLAPARFLGASALISVEGRVLGPHVVEEIASTACIVSLRLPSDLGSRASISAAVVLGGEVAGAWATVLLPTTDRRLLPYLNAGALPDPSGRVDVTVVDGMGRPAPCSVALLAVPVLPSVFRPPILLPEAVLAGGPPSAGTVEEPAAGTPDWLALRWPTPVSSKPLRTVSTAFRATDSGGLAVFDDLVLSPEDPGWTVHTLAVDADSRTGSLPRPLVPRTEAVASLCGPAFLRSGDRAAFRARVFRRYGPAGSASLDVAAEGTAEGRLLARVPLARGEVAEREVEVRATSAGEAEIRAAVGESPLPPVVLRFAVLRDRWGPSSPPWPVPANARSAVPPDLRPAEAGGALFLSIDPVEDPRALVFEALRALPAPEPPREVALLLRAVLAFRASMPPEASRDLPPLLDPAPLVARLWSLRQEDGGWGAGERSEQAETALVTEVLAEARRSGVLVPGDPPPEEGPAEEAALPDAAAAKVRIRELLAARHGPGFDTAEVTILACLELLRARRALGTPRPGETSVRVRTGEGILASVRLVAGDPFRASVAVPLPRPRPDAVIVEAAGDAPVVLQFAATGARTGPGPLALEREARPVPAPGHEAPDSARAGDLLLVTLRAVPTGGALRDVVVECPVPAGAAVLSPAAFPAVPRPPLPAGARLTRRLDRLILELPAVPPEGVELAFLLRPDFRGSFRWPGPFARLSPSGPPVASAPEDILLVE